MEKSHAYLEMGEFDGPVTAGEVRVLLVSTSKRGREDSLPPHVGNRIEGW